MAKTSPKVVFNDKTYYVVEEAGSSIKLTDGAHTFIVLKSNTEPVKDTKKKHVQKQEVAEAEESGTGEG